jgi:TolB protein
MITRPYLKLLFFVFVFSIAMATQGVAQTDLRVSGPKSGFPIAVPQLCDTGSEGSIAKQLPEVISRNLQISGIFKVLNSSTFVETPGKCLKPDEIAYSDWSVIGAEGLIRGEVQMTSDTTMVVTLYLMDVLQRRAVVGKRYSGDLRDYRAIAHRFSNEVMRYFTGKPGVFGTRIAYVSKIGRFKELFVMDIDGQNARQLTRDKGLAISPSWSPVGDRIVYTSYRTRRPELYYVSPEGGAPTQFTHSKGLKLGAKFMPDGRRIVAAYSDSGSLNIVLYDLKGEILKRITRGSSIDVSPSLSPDGTRFAFTSNRSGGPQIYLMPTAGGRAQRISFTNSNYCTSPSWSPKGDKIAFICRNRGNQLFIANPDGTQAAQVTFTGNNEDPTWSPDGNYLAYSSTVGAGGARNIVISSLAGGSPVPITFSKNEDSQPAWSPKVD